MEEGAVATLAVPAFVRRQHPIHVYLSSKHVPLLLRPLLRHVTPHSPFSILAPRLSSSHHCLSRSSTIRSSFAKTIIVILTRPHDSPTFLFLSASFTSSARLHLQQALALGSWSSTLSIVQRACSDTLAWALPGGLPPAINRSSINCSQRLQCRSPASRLAMGFTNFLGRKPPQKQDDISSFKSQAYGSTVESLAPVLGTSTCIIASRKKI